MCFKKKVKQEPVKPIEKVVVQEEKPAEKPVEVKPEEKKEETSKAAPQKKAQPKASKPAPKKEEASKAAPAKKAQKPKEEVIEDSPVTETEEVQDKKDAKRVYHVSKREKDGMWQVKFAGGSKVIKLFKTKVEAVEYTEKMAENQGGVMLKHNSKGANKGKIAKKR